MKYFCCQHVFNLELHIVIITFIFDIYIYITNVYMTYIIITFLYTYILLHSTETLVTDLLYIHRLNQHIYILIISPMFCNARSIILWSFIIL